MQPKLLPLPSSRALLHEPAAFRLGSTSSQKRRLPKGLRQSTTSASQGLLLCYLRWYSNLFPNDSCLIADCHYDLFVPPFPVHPHVKNGRPGGNRTPNLRFWRPLLCQLSYWPLKSLPHLRANQHRNNLLVENLDVALIQRSWRLSARVQIPSLQRQEGSDTAPIMFILERLPPHCSLPA